MNLRFLTKFEAIASYIICCRQTWVSIVLNKQKPTGNFLDRITKVIQHFNEVEVKICQESRSLECLLVWRLFGHPPAIYAGRAQFLGALEGGFGGIPRKGRSTLPRSLPSMGHRIWIWRVSNLKCVNGKVSLRKRLSILSAAWEELLSIKAGRHFWRLDTKVLNM